MDIEKDKANKREWYLRNREFLRNFESSTLFKAYRNLRILLNKRKYLEIDLEARKILDYQFSLLKSAVYEEKKRLSQIKLKNQAVEAR